MESEMEVIEELPEPMFIVEHDDIDETRKPRKRRLGLSQNHPFAKYIKDVVMPRMRNVTSRIEDASEFTWDFISSAHEQSVVKLQELDRFRPRELAQLCAGLLLMLLGHKLRITFAIVEAFRHGGSDELIKHVYLLGDQVQSIRAAHQADNLLDEDNGWFYFKRARFESTRLT
jgi:hypothetical protein